MVLSGDHGKVFDKKNDEVLNYSKTNEQIVIGNNTYNVTGNLPIDTTIDNYTVIGPNGRHTTIAIRFGKIIVNAAGTAQKIYYIIDPAINKGPLYIMFGDYYICAEKPIYNLSAGDYINTPFVYNVSLSRIDTGNCMSVPMKIVSIEEKEDRLSIKVRLPEVNGTIYLSYFHIIWDDYKCPIIIKANKKCFPVTNYRCRS